MRYVSRDILDEGSSRIFDKENLHIGASSRGDNSRKGKIIGGTSAKKATAGMCITSR